MEDPNFSQTLRELRRREGLGRDAIADRADVAVNTVRNAELGSNTSITNLRRLLLAMGYDLKVVRVSKAKAASRLKATSHV